MDSPERSLFCAVLLQAIYDMEFDPDRFVQKSKKDEAIMAKDNAMSWFFNEKHDALITFSDVCDVFDINKKSARDAMKKKVMINGC